MSNHHLFEVAMISTRDPVRLTRPFPPSSFSPSRKKIVEHNHFVPLLHESVHKVRAYEACPSRHENASIHLERKTIRKKETPPGEKRETGMYRVNSDIEIKKATVWDARKHRRRWESKKASATPSSVGRMLHYTQKTKPSILERGNACYGCVWAPEATNMPVTPSIVVSRWMWYLR